MWQVMFEFDREDEMGNQSYNYNGYSEFYYSDMVPFYMIGNAIMAMQRMLCEEWGMTELGIKRIEVLFHIQEF